jgi:hypothetical protein
MADIQPSALRAQQWLIFIFAMISLAVQFVICLYKVPASIIEPRCDARRQQRICLADLACCLLC